MNVADKEIIIVIVAMFICAIIGTIYLTYDDNLSKAWYCDIAHLDMYPTNSNATGAGYC